MGLLLLLTFTLLSSYFHPGRVVNAQESFMIRTITLSIEPSSEVLRGTNVTLRCHAAIGSSGQEALSREYTIFKGSKVVYTKTSSTSEDLLYPLSEARISNTGSYACKINIEGKHMTSDVKELTVTGLSKPVLHVNKSEVTEGEQITARCTAPGETGSIYFYFYEGSKQLSMNEVNSNQAEAKISLTSASTHEIHCTYTVVVLPHTFKSEKSNIFNVKVNALAIEAVLKIFPQSRIYEGDLLFLSCNIRNFQHISESVHLYLYQGNKILSSGDTKVNHSMVALAKDPGEFECIFKMGDIERSDKKKVSVTELFSVPTLTISPAEVFQREHMTLTCKSESSASERLGREELIYTFDPPVSQLSPKGTGVFSGWAPQDDYNYTCVAQAKGIMKPSKTLTVRPKVSVSTPKISVVGKAVLEQPINILCLSDIGSLPINYTLLRGYDQLGTITVKLPSQQAVFKITVTKPDDISKYMCEAKNSHKREGPLSKRLNATVIVPLTQPTLTVVPDLPDISEGDRLYLICGVKGTPPVTFKWYHAGSVLYTTTSTGNNSYYQIPWLSKEHSGTYFCEAINYANNVVRSDQVTIEVRLALWKKVVIGGFCLLALSVLVVVCVLCFRSKRGKREAAAELSVKPSSPKSDDSLTVTLTHDTEVYNADTDAAPLYDGTEGRVTNGARDSVASLPVDISNRSSYSIPATV